MEEHLNILVADDEESILDILKSYLTSSGGHRVFLARNGYEALEIVKKEKIDCCITDISMPGMDGIELAKSIHNIDNTIPIVVMTGYPSLENAIETLKTGVVDFITKPFSVDQIPKIIEKVMNERKVFINNLLLKEEIKKNKELIKINQELKEKAHDLETLNMILQTLNSVSTSNELFRTIVELSVNITRCDEAHFFITAGSKIEESYPVSSYYRDNGNRKKQVDSIIKRDIISKMKEELIPYIIKSSDDSGNIMAVPFKIRSSFFGFLVLINNNQGDVFSEKDLYFVNHIIEKSAFSIENLALYENIYNNLFSTLYALVRAIEAKDPYTKEHSARVTKYAIEIARYMGYNNDEIEILNVAGNLHDIGKIGIPDNILLKPASLTKEEFEIIKKHPVIGANIISQLPMWSNEKEIIKHHHERWDGTGYPDGLSGEDIPIFSRILSVADVYDALTSDRSYRSMIHHDVAVKIIKDNSGKQFDPKVAEAFLDLYDKGIILYRNTNNLTGQ